MSIFGKTSVRMSRMFGLVLAVVVLVAGCTKTDTGSSPESKTPKKDKSEQQLLIGLIPERQIFEQLDRYRPIGDYLSKELGVKVTLLILPQYGNVIDSFVSSHLDGAFFGSFTYALAHAKLGVEVLARPEGLDGTSTYYGMIFVRKDSGIRTARDMKGKRFAFVDRATTAGYLLPLAYFKENHIKDYKTYLKEFYFAGTHEDAIEDVMKGKADIGAAKNTIFEKVVHASPAIGDTLMILEESPKVPENALAVRRDLDNRLKEKLKEALLTMHTREEGRNILRGFEARRFIATTDSDYQAVIKYAREIGLNLATYDYLND